MTQKQLAIKACKVLAQKQIESGSDGFSCTTDADYCTDISWEDVVCILAELEKPEHRIGRWTYIESPHTDLAWRGCSNCGAKPNPLYGNFCANCGSYNGGEQNE